MLLDAPRGETNIHHFYGPRKPLGEPALLSSAEAHNHVPPGTALLTSPMVDVAALARFAATADPELFPPAAAYVRDADAKPQEKFAVARTPA